MNTQKVFKKIKCLAPLCLTGSMLMAVTQSCSTLEAASGRCKKQTSSNYVAAISDTDGKPWEMRISPEVVDLSCDVARSTGELVFSVVILDGQGQTKPALGVSPRFTGSNAISTDESAPGFYGNPYRDTPDKADDKFTDSCGVAVFRMKWVCPDARKSIGGVFYVESGPLFSKSVKVTLENNVQPEVVNPTPIR